MKHPTEKDRVKKVVAEHLGRRCFCKRWETCPVCKLEKLVLKEIKRAERRGRDIERASWMHTIKDVEIKMAQNDAIRNRRKV